MLGLFGFKACPRKERGIGERKLRTSQFKLLPLPKVLALARAQRTPIRRAEERKFEAEASESQKARTWSVYKLIFMPRHRDVDKIKKDMLSHVPIVYLICRIHCLGTG